ncbi:MAG TPA: ABC transporter ATP-binding protein [Candidatus Dormibacteraeota bacterium]|nr:ABC transporter ATP-binding protein [Candidatus Dormibacteraeota bacterium]
MVQALIDIRHVSKVYGGGDVAVSAVDDVTLRIDRGEFVAVMGASGSGKSTLMNILGCLDVPTTGQYRFGGEEVATMTEGQLAQVRNRRIGFVFQQFQLLDSLPAWRNVELPLLYRTATDRKLQAIAALQGVGLADRINHRPTELSGGQQQRVAIARALVTDPDLILADEPTGNLDSASSGEILEILVNLHGAGRTIVLITHDAQVARVATRQLTMRDGKVLEAVAA